MSRPNTLDRRGYVFTPTSEQLKRIRMELRFRPDIKLDFGPPPKAFNCYEILPDGTAIVPRAWGIKNCGTPQDDLPDGEDLGDHIQLTSDFRLDSTRSQDVAANTIAQTLQIPTSRGGATGLISLPCGGGKTVLFIYVIARLVRKKTVIVVHTNQLADQWEERLRAFCPSIRIGRIQAQIANVDADVIICMLQTLTMKELPPSLFDGVGLMGIDECHLVSTETFSKVLSRWNVKRIFGLSATPERKDKLEKVLYAHIGGIVYSGTREHVPMKIIFVYPDVSQKKEIMNIKTQKVDQVAMITELVNDNARTTLIATKAVEYKTTKVLVLSERRKHLEDIRTQIEHIDPSATVGLYRGQMKPEDLKKSELCDIILGTYSIASVGLDIRGLNTLILATPRSDVIQASGRIQRDLSPLFGKTLIDFYDKFSVFQGQYSKRHAFYKTSGFQIEGNSKKRTSTHTETQPPPAPSPFLMQCLIQSD